MGDSDAANTDQNAVKWVGHASAHIAMAGESVLIDPLGRRRTRELDYKAVLITHSHVDHLNRWTLADLDKSAALYVPKGAKSIVADLGFASVTEVEPGDQLAIGSLEVTCVETRHDNGRWRKGDLPLCSGYVIEADGQSVYHAGDVDMSDLSKRNLFDDLAKQFRIDVALLPIGGMLPVWYYRSRRSALDRGVHIDPDTALEIFETLGAETLVPIHWGTVNLRLGGVAGPKKRLIKVAESQGLSEKVAVLSHGESLELGCTEKAAR